MNLNIERDGKTCLQRCMGRFMWSLLVVSVLWCAHALKTVECSSAHCYRCMCVLVCTRNLTHLERISSSSSPSTVIHRDFVSVLCLFFRLFFVVRRADVACADAVAFIIVFIFFFYAYFLILLQHFYPRSYWFNRIMIMVGNRVQNWIHIRWINVGGMIFPNQEKKNR